MRHASRLHPATSYTWFGCDLVTGRIIEELPIDGDVTLPMVISAYGTTDVTIPLADAPPDWRQATEPGHSMIVCSRDFDHQIMWAGLVTSRSGGSEATLKVNAASCEAYLERRYVGTKASHAQADEAAVARSLLAPAATDGIGLIIDAPDTGTLVDREYASSEDKTVYAALTELSDVENGGEWMIDYHWDGASVVKTFRWRKQLGMSPNDQVAPDATFDFPGTVVDYELVEDFTTGKGANYIAIYGTQEEGADEKAPRPRSDFLSDPDVIAAGFPRFTLRETRDGISKKNVLDQHAREVLAWTRLGARTLTFTADAETAPRFKTSWALGDTVRLYIAESPRHTEGLELTGRVIGAEVGVGPSGTVNPTVLLPGQREEDGGGQ